MSFRDSAVVTLTGSPHPLSLALTTLSEPVILSRDTEKRGERNYMM